MPNLRSMEAARRGWDIFTSTTPTPSLEEINEQLASESLSISARMYQHYRRLQRFGRRSYVPINELDVVMKGRRGGPRR